MARFSPQSEADKQALIARANALKPRYLAGVIATDKGWAQVRPSGYVEVLVCFAGLDELLGSEATADQDVAAAPVEVAAEPAPAADEEKVEEAAPVVEAPKKKGGRPKKVEAPVDDSEPATEEKAAE